MEKILKIKIEDFEIEKEFKYNSGGKYKEPYTGYSISTEKQKIIIGISSKEQCCESVGAIVSEDDLQYFVGSNILSISITDIALNNIKIELDKISSDAESMFINIETTNGLLQFACYNTNGMYGHEAVLKSVQLDYSKGL